jgi:hypothetical protein
MSIFLDRFLTTLGIASATMLDFVCCLREFVRGARFDDAIAFEAVYPWKGASGGRCVGRNLV